MTGRTILRSLCIVAPLVLAAMPAAGQDFIALPAASTTFPIEGEAVRIDIAADYRILPLGAANQVDLRVRLGLGDLQARAPAILTALAARRVDAVSFSFPRLDPPQAGDGAIWLTGLLRIRTADPLFGAPVDGVAAFRLALRPEATATSVGVAADLTYFDLGNALMEALGVEAALAEFVEGELRRGFAEVEAVFTMPPELVALGVAINAVSVVDIGGGVPGLYASASAILDGAQLMTAIIQLTTAFGS
ncbi:MAG: hypothetical protein KIS96_12120 [Bauldia sp.]|nr:hypothetical protein [Bauldia sp.]